MNARLSLALAKKLLVLVQEKQISKSAFGNSRRLETLIEEGIVYLQVNGQKTRIFLESQYRLEVYLNSLGINDLEAYIHTLENPHRSRADLMRVSNSSKSASSRVQSGLYMASYEPVDIMINSESIRIDTPAMCTFFVHENAELKIPEDVTVVGVENFENLSFIKKQKGLFDDGEKKLFIYRNRAAREFLGRCFNDYIHYGDFDLAGVHIFLHEIVPRLPHERYRFFLPENIETFLDYGNAQDYFVQMKRYPNLRSKIGYIQEFIELLHSKKRSLHQEYFVHLE